MYNSVVTWSKNKLLFKINEDKILVKIYRD